MYNRGTREVEVFRHGPTGFVLVGTFGGDDAVRAEPFEEVEITPAWLWGRSTERRAVADEDRCGL